MNIGIDVSDLATGRADGTTRYTAELARRLPSLGGQHQWNFFTPSTPALPIDTGNNVSWHVSPWPKYWTQFRLPLDLYRHPCDVLLMPIQQLPIIRPKRMKTVAVVHDLAFHFHAEQTAHKDWALLHMFTAMAVRQADKIIAVSQSTANDIERLYGRTKEVHVIHHGVDHSQFCLPQDGELAISQAALAEKYPDLTKPYILFVGQIQPRKNLVRLIEAFEMLAPSMPELSLVIAGSHGWLQEPIVKRIAQSFVSNRILMLGRVPDELLPALYWHAECLVLPSLYEGFGLPILEAMASGCPVVTSNVSSMAEIAGEAAVLIDPQATSSIAAGINEARSNRQALIEQGIRQAAKFTWRATAAATYNLLIN